MAQYSTFYCGDSLFGLDIGYVQEINRTSGLTGVPLAANCVRGVMNLRGEVVTMLDLRTLLGLPSDPNSAAKRNLILKCDGDIFGVCVDGVADILTIESDSITAPPSNLSINESKLIKGVYQSDTVLIMLIDPREILNASLASIRTAA
ncbi:MAG: chemotaxis protein CheW [Pirellula sp.]|jgi:purine-binding chemotaxis protein CheW|nr:chemotaxis protein CheW [Pirellula sp.]